MRTQQRLAVFWPVVDENAQTIAHDEFDGFVLFSLWAEPVDNATERCLERRLVEMWPVDSVEVRVSGIYAEEYCNLIGDVRVKHLPPVTDWRPLIEASLRLLISAGAVLAWIADHWSFSWPGLFDEGSEIYAALSKETGFLGCAGLDEDVTFLDEGELAKLRVTLRELEREGD